MFGSCSSSALGSRILSPAATNVFISSSPLATAAVIIFEKLKKSWLPSPAPR